MKADPQYRSRQARREWWFVLFVLAFSIVAIATSGSWDQVNP